MKTLKSKRRASGFVSYVMVLTTGTILTLLMIYAYRSAMIGQSVQAAVQLQADYSEKEEAILRSIVAITPNRAIRAMQNNSNTVSDPLRWQSIFTESLVMANARTSISSSLQASLNITNLKSANMGDSALGTPSLIFKAAKISSTANAGTSYVTAGSMSDSSTLMPDAGYPSLLKTSNSTITSTTVGDSIFPIISDRKRAVGLAAGTVPNFNILTYPKINFGYAKPGDPFVAKRNWWAFSMNVADNDVGKTRLVRPARNMVLSIYEIPSQLAISASSFMSLGQYASGEAWQNVSIAGNVFAGKAAVEGMTTLPALASRRGMTLSSGATVGGQSFTSSPFTPGVREFYQLTQGEFFPVSLASESGRVAFIPINRGADFFDRFTHATESNTVSPTTWNNYSIGALQCAMRLDVTQVVSATNKTPTNLRFSYLKNGARQDLDISLTTGVATGVPIGYLLACSEDQTYNFGSAMVDVIYGGSGYARVSTGPEVWKQTTNFTLPTSVTGSVTFNNARFGDPLFGVGKYGYYKPSYPFEVKTLTSGKICISVYPQRFAMFLKSINADGPAVNNSLVVNVDYTTATGSVWLTKPAIPCTDLDYGVILKECANITDFTKGFSLVSNLRTYIGDDFNVIQYTTTPPTGYTPPAGKYFPPCSLFVPEKRYGVDVDPFAVDLGGQIGSLASDTDVNPVRPMDSKTMTGVSLAASRITVNLRPITNPIEMPPITMMNWLVIIEERKKEFVGY